MLLQIFLCDEEIATGKEIAILIFEEKSSSSLETKNAASQFIFQNEL